MTKYRMICADIDGTLVTSDNRLTQRTRETVKKAVSQGAVFALISARPPEGMFYLNDEIGIDQYIVSFGGSLILKRGRGLYADVLRRSR